MSLHEYERKRDFGKTAEPRADKQITSADRFVIQKHDATRLHYDFRLELEGTLKSWAVPKGMPFARGEKRLAVRVEDHPVAYAEFEGIIPKGQYGGGTVMVWDRGTFEPLSNSPVKELGTGKLHFILHGKKLEGEWYLVRLRDDEKQWLLIKGGDDMKPVSKKLDNLSVLSGKTMSELARGDRVWHSGRASQASRSISSPAKHVAASLLPPFVQPMDAHLGASPPGGNWIYEIKFDGWRAVALKGGSQIRLLSRIQTDLGAKFPDIMQSIAELDAQDCVLDGEIVALDEKGRSSLALLQTHDLDRKKAPTFFYAFDLLQLNGKDLKELPLKSRKAKLQRLLKDATGFIRFSADLNSDVATLLSKVRELGLEGLVGKLQASVYEPGHRSRSWVKLKLSPGQEFVIGGYSETDDRRTSIGSVIVGFYEKNQLLFAGRVSEGLIPRLAKKLHSRFKKIACGSCPFPNLPLSNGSEREQSLTAEEMEEFYWVKPEIVCQVKFSGWTEDNRLIHPVFLGIREDKAAEEVVRERVS